MIVYKLSLTGTTASEYESCSTRHYQLGRTETIRSTTVAAQKLYDVWTNPQSTVVSTKT